MKRRWLIVGGLVLLNVAAMAGVMVSLWAEFSWENTYLEFMALLPALGAILATAVVFWGRGTSWRLAGVTIFWVALPRLLALDATSEYGFVWTIVLCGVFATTPALVLMRFLGIRLQWEDAVDVRRPDPADLLPRQFSLRSMMEWVAAVAIILGTLTYLPIFDQSFESPRGFVAMTTLVLMPPTVPILVSVLWLTLGKGRIVLRTTVFAANCLLIGLGLCTISVVAGGATWSDAFPLLYVVAANVLWQTITFFGLRLAGLEIVYRRAIIGREPGIESPLPVS